MARISAQPTPNPNSLKFTQRNRTFIESGLYTFASAEEAAAHPLASALFGVDGVVNVLILPEFLTVTKNPNTSWRPLQKEIERILASFYD